MTQLIGIDVGYGFVKVTDGQVGYSFPSVVGEGHTKPTFSMKIGTSPAIDQLRIGIGDRLFLLENLPLNILGSLIVTFPTPAP